eukprot:TRINITY_DN124014_c0_g1_i1.p1 TRINITY_DN124014_c0_g1~~TRINITY_DN124014_c0_g1_i1.p1  ORF type:complete len:114 (-),score=18.53 TRINITY_DN124014_c0_g1_i1:33-374(-)
MRCDHAVRNGDLLSCAAPSTHSSIHSYMLVNCVPGKPSHVPVISQGPVNTTVVEGATAQLGCGIHNNSHGAHSSLKLQWLFHYSRNGSYEDRKGNPYTIVLNVRDARGDSDWS